MIDVDLAIQQADRALGAGDPGAALDGLLAAVRGGSDDPRVWTRFARIVAGADNLAEMTFHDLDALLGLCLVHAAVSPRLLGDAPGRHLRRHPLLAPLLAAPSPRTLTAGLDDPATWAALSAPTTRAILEVCVVADAGWDRLVAAVRRRLLLTLAGRDRTPGGLDDTAFLAALARQCFFTGYVQEVADDEVAAVEEMVAGMSGRAVGSSPDDAARVLLLAAYLPLVEWERVEEVAHWAAEQGDPGLDAVLREQVFDAVEEADLAEALPSVSPVDDATSRTVRALYEDHPYPRWHRPVRRDPTTLEALLHEVLPGPPPPGPLPRSTPLRVLVAGCGTGSHPVATRLMLRDSQVVGLDLSRASLAFAMRKTLELGIDGVGYVHGDLLALEGWDARFDLVEAMGVLHHLEDPVRGWRILAGLLDPGGILRVGLYSARARRGIEALRAHLDPASVGTDPESLRDARRRALAFLRTHPDGPSVVRWRDFHSLHEFRDLVLHPVEHRFGPARIGQIVEELGLEFLGFGPVSEAAVRRFRDRWPAPEALRDPRLWDSFEADYPDTFRGMIQFWLRKPSP